MSAESEARAYGLALRRNLNRRLNELQMSTETLAYWTGIDLAVLQAVFQEADASRLDPSDVRMLGEVLDVSTDYLLLGDAS